MLKPITEEKFLELQSQFDDLSDMTYEEFVEYNKELEAEDDFFLLSYDEEDYI